VSRLTHSPFPFDTQFAFQNARDEEWARLENVYAGAALVKRAFPDITHVTEAVLECFRLLPPHISIRDSDHFVKRFDQVQYGEVHLRNLPDNWEDDPDLWQHAYPRGSVPDAPAMTNEEKRNWIDKREELENVLVRVEL
jgi:hypothetical protein